MGHYSTLWISSDLNRTDGEIAEHEIYQEVKYAIPLFWLALFRTEHIIKLRNDSDELYYRFEAPAHQCITIFKERLNIWTPLFNNNRAEILATTFLQFLRNYSQHIIVLDVYDILSMYIDYSSQEAELEMRTMINWLEEKHLNPSSEHHNLLCLPVYELKTSQDRYLLIDGFGKELLPCPEVDEWLKKNETEITQDYIESNVTEYDYSIDEETFYRILITKGEVFSENLLGFKHRYTFLVRISDSKKRTIFVNSLLIAEIIYFAFFWFILVIIGILLLSWDMINNTIGKAFATIATLGFITWYFWKKIAYRINLLKNLKPMIG